MTILVPVLFILSVELSLLVLLIIPPFIFLQVRHLTTSPHISPQLPLPRPSMTYSYLHHPPFIFLQLRAGRFIVKAANEVRLSETNYMRSIEENLVFASARKLFGLGPMFDAKLIILQAGSLTLTLALPVPPSRSPWPLPVPPSRSPWPLPVASLRPQEDVVEKFDVLDIFEAKSQMQVDAFSRLLLPALVSISHILSHPSTSPHASSHLFPTPSQVDAFSFTLAMGVFAVGLALMSWEVCDLPTSPRISPHLPTSPHISHISPHLPTSPHMPNLHGLRSPSVCARTSPGDGGVAQAGAQEPRPRAHSV